MHRSFVVIFFLLFAGCLPHSCTRTPSQALFPSDSLSRMIAAETPAESLEFVAATDLSDRLEHPRTMLVGPDAKRLYVADTRLGSVLSIGIENGAINEIAGLDVAHPYLAGTTGDGVAVLDPFNHVVHLVEDGAVRRSVALEVDVSEHGLTYALAHDGGFAYKIVVEDDTSRVLEFDPAGELLRTHALAGPHWRHAGLMRLWGETPVSLTGYRPVVDLIQLDGSLDSLQLQGFDSPMLPRSRRFVTGDVSEAPLLSSSADPAGDLLFVLNLRAGWVQVDAYDAGGMLRHVFVEPDPQPGRRFFPVDLAVHEASPGVFDVFVLLAQPAPRILHFRARPQSLALHR